jgi:Rrf2 family protein
MKISAKGEYALKAMLDLSMRESSGLVSIQEIAARQSIPQRYLEQVLLQLKRASLLTSKRGAAGGYHLTRSPGEITVGEVLRAVEGEVAPFEAARRPRRGAADHGSDLTELWDDLSRAVSEVIDRKTFGDLAARAAERRSAARPMYHI